FFFLFFFFKQKTAYEIFTGLEFRRVLFRSVLSAVAVWRFGATAEGLGAVVLTCFLIALAFIDLDTQLLPDSMTLPLLWLGLLFRSEERRVGQGCRYEWARYCSKNQTVTSRA